MLLNNPAVPHPADHADLSGLPLGLARGLWLATFAVVVGLTLAGAPARYADLLANADPRPLAQLGLSPAAYVGYTSLIEQLGVAAHLLTAAYIFARRSAQRMCLLVSFTLIVNGAIVPFALFFGGPDWAPAVRLLAQAVISMGLASSLAVLYLFPDGRFVPGWARLLLLLWAAQSVVAIFLPRLPFSLPALPGLAQLVLLLAWAGTGVYAQVYCYRHISNLVQRQQAKWASLGLVAAVFGPLAYFVPFVILPAWAVPELPRFLYQRVGPGFFAMAAGVQLASQTVFAIGLMLFPLLFAIAILRFRLWDIDLLINRALVYGTLTAMLAAAYLLAVVLLHSATTLLTGERQSTIATVASTLLIASLAAPLRRRVQNGIDRRFYRRKYDAVRTLAEFGSAVRDEVDLDHLNERLVAVVTETMQPQQAWLWLKPGK
jgi:hypothetical protein